MSTTNQRFIGYALDEAIARRRNVRDVKVEYGALRIRFDLKDDGELEVVEEKGEEVLNVAARPRIYSQSVGYQTCTFMIVHRTGTARLGHVRSRLTVLVLSSK